MFCNPRSEQSRDHLQVTILFIGLPDFQYDTPDQLTRNQDAFMAIQKALNKFDGALR